MTTDRLLLNDLLHLTEDELMRTKIRFCIQPSQETYNPIEIFKSNPDAINSGWLFDRKKKNIFQIGETAICLVRLSNDPDLWLLTTVKTITKDTGRYGGGIGWEGEEWSQYKPYYGRTIIRHHKGQETFIKALSANGIETMEVLQLLPDLYEDNPFPGYDNICLPWREVQRIINRNLSDWRNALEHQKGIYVITDLATGKQYVGSATAKRGMLLKRWSDYVRDGHGGDIALRQLVKEKGKEYVEEYFQYTLLENYNQRTNDNYILEMESWWKKALDTREHGYNEN